MPKLERVTQALAERGKIGPDISEIIAKAVREAVNGLPTQDYVSAGRELDSLRRQLERALNDIEKLKTQPVLTEGMMSNFKRLEKGIERGFAINAPKDFDYSGFDKLGEKIESFIQAVNGIKIPEVPPFPEIPEMDMSPLMYWAEKISAQLDAMQQEEVKEEVEEVKEAPREWTFNVKRNQAGFIRTVEVVEK